MSLRPADLALLLHQPPARKTKTPRPRRSSPRRIGERHHNATLTNAQVRQLREEYAKWSLEDAQLPRGDRRHSYPNLALRYKCGAATIRDLVKGRTRLDAGGPVVWDRDAS